MSGIKIRGTGRFAPAKIVTNDDLAKSRFIRAPFCCGVMI